MVTDREKVTISGRLLGLEAAAAYLDTTERSVRRLIERGVLQPVAIPMLRRVLIDRQDLDHLIDAGKLRV